MQTTVEAPGGLKSDNSRLLLTSLLSLAGHLISSIIFFITTPIFFSHLGERLFGTYQFCQKLSVYGVLTNLGATSFLKIRLASLRSTDAPQPKRLAVGICLVQWLLMLPFAIGLCLAGAWFISRGHPVQKADFWAVFAILALVPISNVLSIPNVALFASNLGYKSALVAPLSTFLGAILAVCSVYAGFGLSGIAVSLYAATLTASVLAWRIARAHLPWFGFGRATARDVFGTIKPSAGAAFASIGYLGLQQIENLTIGAVFGPAMLGKLVVTGVAAHFVELIVKQFVNASTPSVSVLIAGEHTRRLDRVRGEAYRYITICYVLAAPAVILLSQAFVTAWVGRDAFISAEVVAFLLVAGALRLMALVDAVLLDQLGDFFAKSGMAFMVVGGPLLLALQAGPGDQNMDYWCVLILFVMFLNTLTIHRRASKRLLLSSFALAVVTPALAATISLVAWKTMNLANAEVTTQLVAVLSMEFGSLLLLLAIPTTRTTLFDLSHRLGRFSAEMRARRR